MLKDNFYVFILVLYSGVLLFKLCSLIYSFRFGKRRVSKESGYLRYSITVMVLGVITLFVSALFRVNFLDYKPPISHADFDKITLKDFNGFKAPGQNLYGVKEFAFITSSIEWRFVENGIEVTSFFHPSRSYVYDRNIDDVRLLNHELHHFHITEYWTRRIRQDLSRFSSLPSSDKVEAIILDNKNRESSMQRNYDHETYHSYLLGRQISWEKKIDSLLNTLDKYTFEQVRY